MIFDLGFEGFCDYIKIIGLFNFKVNNVYKMCEILVNKYNLEVFENCEVFEVLFGVGRKIVNVVLNCVFGWFIIVVDMYIFCVFNCIKFVMGKDVVVVE